jgi:tetratricopeptide (TPR) repeat protein
MGPEWLLPVGQAYARAGRLEESREILVEIEDRLGDPAVASGVSRVMSRERALPLLLRGEIDLASGDTHGALEAFELASTYDEEKSLEPLARCHAQRGDLEAAIEAYEKLISDVQLGYEAQLDWIEAHYHLGRLYDRAGQPDKATDAYRRLLQIWSEADPQLILATEAKKRLQ